MNSQRPKYRGSDLAIMVPTRNRPDKIRDLFHSLLEQSVQCGRIIVVASGTNIEDLVLSYADRLPVEYYHCNLSGQIKQRNMAISLLNERTPLAASLDDDIVMEREAVAQMIDFWNSCDPDTAGVSFNIINSPPFRHSWLKSLIGMSSPVPGRVLRSSYNVALFPADKNFKSQWLCGGATVWRQEILKQNPHREIKSRWAICEDALFSYPIGKNYPLYVCAAARVRHEHVYDHTATMKFRYYGRTVTLWRLYFVEQHAELSRLAYSWMIWGQIVARFFSGLATLNPDNLQYALGQFEGLITGILAVIRGKKVVTLLEE